MKFTKLNPTMNESIENFKKSEVKEGLELKDEKITPVADVIFSDALSQHEIVKQDLEKKMKEKDKEVEEMVKDQEKEGPDKVKEDGTPKGLVVESLLEGYTFDNNEGAYSVHVPSRNELGKLIRGLKESNVEYKISRSKTEGFRYDFNFTYKPLNEDFQVEREGEKDNEYVVIDAGRDGYGISQVEDSTMTVGELIDILSRYDENTKIVIGNDWQHYGYYTYGYISEGRIDGAYVVEPKEDEDEEEFESLHEAKGKIVNKPIKESKEDERQAWEDDDTVNTLVDFIEDMKNNDCEELEARKEKYLAVLEKSLEMAKQFAGKADEGLGLLGIGDVNVNLDASGTNAALGFGGGKGTNESLEESKETKEDINITNNDSPSRVDTKEITKEEPREEPKIEESFKTLDEIANEDVPMDDTDTPLDESVVTEEGKEVGNLLNKDIDEGIISGVKTAIDGIADGASNIVGDIPVVGDLLASDEDEKEDQEEREDCEDCYSSMHKFKPCKEALDTWNKIKRAGLVETLAFALEDIYPDGFTNAQLNESLTNDSEWILGLVGLNEVDFKGEDF